MNKKEVLEIRKLVAKEDCRIDRICGCYVDGQKEKKMTMKEAFLSIPEEEMFKYTEIFKKTLSGTIGKNLLNLEFPLEEELSGTHQRLLQKLVDSGLQDDEVLDTFYEQVIGNYLNPENYLILLVHGVYDIPAKASDNQEMFDASDYVYSFVLCSICPVNLSKPGLCYDADRNSFIDKLQDWMVQMPETGFLYPAFHDRNTDLHALLYYTKNAEFIHSELTEELLGCVVPTTAKDQKETFQEMVEETFGRDCDFEVARTIHENLNRMLEEKKEDPEPLSLDTGDVKRLLATCGAEPEQLKRFEETYEEQEEHPASFLASNLASTRTFEVKSPDVTVRVSPERTDLIETRVIDGQKYLMIPMVDEVEVNGIRIHTTEEND